MTECRLAHLDITTLDKEVEKSVCKVGGEGAHHPRVEEGYVGDLETDRGIVKKGIKY